VALTGVADEKSGGECKLWRCLSGYHDWWKHLFEQLRAPACDPALDDGFCAYIAYCRDESIR
jgi:hypothetical protein